MPLVCKVDNTQAIEAAKKGYSKRLRYLNRIHRIAIGSLHEIFGDREQCCRVECIESAKQKGNIYTKSLSPAQLIAGRELVGMHPAPS